MKTASKPAETVGYIELTSVVWPENDQWVSQCIELDIASSGETAEEAQEELKDAVCAYLNTLEELGEREKVFEQREIQLLTRPTRGTFRPRVPRDLIERFGAQVRPLSLPVTGGVQAYA